jgi:hypothetical protein
VLSRFLLLFFLICCPVSWFGLLLQLPTHFLLFFDLLSDCLSPSPPRAKFSFLLRRCACLIELADRPASVLDWVSTQCSPAWPRAAFIRFACRSPVCSPLMLLVSPTEIRFLRQNFNFVAVCGSRSLQVKTVLFSVRSNASSFSYSH